MSIPTFSETVIPDEILPQAYNDLGEDDTPEADSSGRTCEVCGTALAYAGRGRPPRFCEDHKANKSAKPADRITPNTARNKDEKLASELASLLGLIGLGLYSVEQFDGTVLMSQAEPTAKALVIASQQNKQLRAMLEQLVMVSVWGAVASALAGIIVPILAHHRIIPMDEIAVSKMLLPADTVTNLENLRRPKAAA